MFPSSAKREIRHFYVVFVQQRQRNVQSVMHVQSCFANLNLLLFWLSCCRRRRRCLGCHYKQQRPRSGTSRSHNEHHAGVVDLRGFVALNPSLHSLVLKTYFRLSGFHTSLLLIHFRCGPTSTWSHCTIVWNRAYLICDAPLSRSCRAAQPHSFTEIASTSLFLCGKEVPSDNMVSFLPK